MFLVSENTCGLCILEEIVGYHSLSCQKRRSLCRSKAKYKNNNMLIHNKSANTYVHADPDRKVMFFAAENNLVDLIQDLV